MAMLVLPQRPWASGFAGAAGDAAVMGDARKTAAFIVFAWRFHEGCDRERFWEEFVAVDISRKLCLTAAWLRADSRKELAAAFRRVNAATPFDLQRAHKWLQGRALPRGRQMYEDWALLVGLGEGADWIAECPAETFLERLRVIHGVDPEALRRRAEAFAGTSGTPKGQGRDLELLGSYACYSHAWARYYRSRLIRGTLTIAPGSGPSRLRATYAEDLPTGPMRLSGPLMRGERVVTAHLGDPSTSAQLFFWLFAPAPPTTVLGGFMSGTTLMSAEAQLSATRLLAIRLPPAPADTTAAGQAYLPADHGVAADLARSGLSLASPGLLDAAVAEFLGQAGAPIDQITQADYRGLVELLDRHWLEFRAGSGPPAHPARGEDERVHHAHASRKSAALKVVTPTTAT
jgi:hypothetical protein